MSHRSVDIITRAGRRQDAGSAGLEARAPLLLIVDDPSRVRDPVNRPSIASRFCLSSPLVPKLCFGTHLLAKLCFAEGDAMRNRSAVRDRRPRKFLTSGIASASRPHRVSGASGPRERPRLWVLRNTEEDKPTRLIDGTIKSSILVISQPSPGNSVKLSARCGFLAQCIMHRGFP